MGTNEKRFWLAAFVVAGLAFTVSNVGRWRADRNAIRLCGELKASFAAGGLPMIRTTTSTVTTVPYVTLDAE